MLDREDSSLSHRIPLDQTFVASVGSVADLLQWHDDVFVELAYHVMFGRPADVGGRHYYLTRLRAGRSRLSILDQLSKSDEVRSDRATLRNLQSELARYRASRRLFRGLRARWTDPELGTRSAFVLKRAVSNELGRTRQDIMLACSDLKAGQRDLGRWISRDGMPAVSVAQPVAPASVVHTPRVRSPFDVRELDFHSSEKRVMSALRI